MTLKKNFCSINMFRHTTIVHPLPPEVEHGLAGSGDKLFRLKNVGTELQRGAGSGSRDGDNEGGV